MGNAERHGEGNPAGTALTAKDKQRAMKLPEKPGLNPDEEAFYPAPGDRPDVLIPWGNSTLKKLSSEQTEKLGTA